MTDPLSCVIGAILVLQTVTGVDLSGILTGAPLYIALQQTQNEADETNEFFASLPDVANNVADAMRNVLPDSHASAFYTAQATVIHTDYAPPTDNLSAAILGGAIVTSATVIIVKQLISRCRSGD